MENDQGLAASLQVVQSGRRYLAVQHQAGSQSLLNRVGQVGTATARLMHWLGKAVLLPQPGQQAREGGAVWCVGTRSERLPRRRHQALAVREP